MFLGESLCSIRCHASACGLARARCPGTVKGSGNIPLWPFVCMKLSFSVWYGESCASGGESRGTGLQF